LPLPEGRARRLARRRWCPTSAERRPFDRNRKYENRPGGRRKYENRPGGRRLTKKEGWDIVAYRLKEAGSFLAELSACILIILVHRLNLKIRVSLTTHGFSRICGRRVLSLAGEERLCLERACLAAAGRRLFLLFPLYSFL
jgi:hypothetical protein